MISKNFYNKEFSQTVVAYLIFVFTRFLLLKLFAIYLSPFEFGSLAIFLFAITSISQVTSGPIQSAIMRLSNEAYELGEINYLYLSTIRIFKKQLFFIFISSILINLILKILFNIKFYIVYLLFLIFNLFGSGITDIKYSLFGGLRDRKSQIIISLCEILIKPTILFLVFIKFIPDHLLIIYAISFSQLICFLTQEWLISKKQNNLNVTTFKIFQFEKKKDVFNKWFKKINSFKNPIKIWSIPEFFRLNSYVYLLKFLEGNIASAVLAILLKSLYSPLMLLNGFPLNYIEPIIYQSVDSKNKKSSNFNFEYFHLIYLSSLLIILIPSGYFFGEEIITLFSSEKYLDYANFVLITLITSAFIMSTEFRIRYLSAMYGSKYCLDIKIISSILGIGVNIFAIFYYGLRGGLYAFMFYSNFIFLISSIKPYLPRNFTIMKKK
tara:strand:- start:48 stop:1361 length:1314 start_codon:yes stop_codon:yes gene_type:complete